MMGGWKGFIWYLAAVTVLTLLVAGLVGLSRLILGGGMIGLKPIVGAGMGDLSARQNKPVYV